MLIVELIHRYSKKIIIGSVLIFICFMIISSFKGSDSKADASTTNQKYFLCITIDYGDTLYDIATEYISEEYDSIDDYIAEVKSINNLVNDSIQSGATLVVPYFAANKL